MTLRDALRQRAINAKADVRAIAILVMVGCVALFFLALLLVVVGAIVAPFITALAAEPAIESAPGRWVLVECPPDQPCRPRGKALSAATACTLDLASHSVVVASGTRLSCLRIEGAKR